MIRAGFYTPAGSRTLSRRGWASRRGFSPGDLPGLQLWLDAQSPAHVLQTGLTPATNGTRVVRIVDRAQGLQFDEVSSSGPTLVDDSTGANGRRLLRFNGSSQYLRHAGTMSTGTSGEAFIVLRPTKATSGTWVVFGSADEAGGNFFWYLGSTVTGGGTEYFRYYERNTGSVDTLTLNTEIGRAAPGNCYLLHVRSDATGTGTISAEVNEAPQTLSAFSGTNNGDWIGNVLNRDSVGLGALLRDTVSAHFGGDVYEIIQVDGVLTVPQRVAVNRYLRQRYAPLLQTACLGDSLTSASPGYVDTLRTMFGDDSSCSVSFVNHGVGGEAIGQMRTRWDANIEGRGYRALVLMGGVNDLRVASAGAAAAIWPNFTAIYDEALAAGMRIVACTVAPFGNHAHWSSTRQTELVALNGMIANYVTQHPQEMALVDGNALLRTPGTPEDLLAAYDSGDGLHWNTAGHDVFAAAVETALRAVLGE
jgi:lysophospholipase L1-like esterase